LARGPSTAALATTPGGNHSGGAKIERSLSGSVCDADHFIAMSAKGKHDAVSGFQVWTGFTVP
jgi:hypothetical protein